MKLFFAARIDEVDCIDLHSEEGVVICMQVLEEFKDDFPKGGPYNNILKKMLPILKSRGILINC